jgi:hypothetical protein
MDTYAKVSKIAYQDPKGTADVASMFSHLLPVKKAFFISGPSDVDVQMYTLILTDSTVVFAFRGTESASDATCDLSVWKRKFRDVSDPKIKVHTGFLDQFNVVKFGMTATLFGTLWKHKNSKTRIICTGHSLGGALATVAAACIKALFKDAFVVECYTFGSPRVGNSHFVNFFDKHVDRSIRCVHSADIVTRIPSFLYEHVGGEYKIGDPPTCFGRMFGSVQDHSLDLYIERLTPPTKTTSTTPTEPAVNSSEPVETPTAPVESLETPTAPAESLETPTAPAESLETPTAPVESLETPTEPVESLETPTEPVESLETPTEPVESLETPTSSTDSVHASSVVAIVGEEHVGIEEA